MRRVAAAGVGLAIILSVATYLRYRGDPGWMYDAKVYRTAGAALLRGLDLYAAARGQHFTYPPFAAVVFAPLSRLPDTPFAVLWTAMSVASLEVAAWLSLGWVGVRDLRLRSILVAATCVLGLAGFEPVSLTVLAGQVNLFLMCAILGDLHLPDGNPWKGVGIGLAAGVKLLPAFFIPYLLLTRRFRAAAVATLAGAATVGIGFLAAPVSSAEYWGGVFLDSRRVGDPQAIRSQSVQSLLVRWLHTTQGVRPLWALLTVAIVAVALYLALRAHRQGDELLAACVCGVATLLISPITWQHHWVWMAPMVIWIAARGIRERSLGLAVTACLVAVEFFITPYRWGVPGGVEAELHLNLAQLLLSSTYALTAGGLLVLAGVLIRRDQPAAADRPAAARPATTR
jgi:alpha-1,2-mannosyltransferase